jgi:NAD(P)H-flavin reductase
MNATHQLVFFTFYFKFFYLKALFKQKKFIQENIQIRNLKRKKKSRRKYGTSGIGRICEDPRDDTKTTLLYANKTEEDILLKDELDKFAAQYEQFNVHYVLSSPSESWKGEKGRISKEMIERRLPAPAGMDSKVLVCGPDPMMESMVSMLQERGFKPPGMFRLLRSCS